MATLPDRPTPVTQKMFDEIYGSSLICCQIMLVLYGVASLQTYMFFLNYPRDSTALKALVFWIWCLGTVHAIFISHTVYHYLVKSYSNPSSLVDGEWSVYSGTVVGVVICFFIQVFFARMIYHLTKGRLRWILTAVFSVLILGQVAFGIFFSYKLFALWELLALHAAVYPAMVPLFLIRVVSDALTAGTLCVILYDSRGFSKSMKLVKTLIIYAMNRFILTTAVVIMQTIVLIVKPESIWAMVIEFISAQLYINSFLATLNSRNRLRQIGGGDSLYTEYTSTTRGGRRGGNRGGGGDEEGGTISVARFRRETSTEVPTIELEEEGRRGHRRADLDADADASLDLDVKHEGVVVTGEDKESEVEFSPVEGIRVGVGTETVAFPDYSLGFGRDEDEDFGMGVGVGGKMRKAQKVLG